MEFHMGVETILVYGGFVPSGAGLVCHELNSDDGFDALESIFPRNPNRTGALSWGDRARLNQRPHDTARFRRLNPLDYGISY